VQISAAKNKDATVLKFANFLKEIV
jgi:hypothetical protein